MLVISLSDDWLLNFVNLVGIFRVVPSGELVRHDLFLTDNLTQMEVQASES